MPVHAARNKRLEPQEAAPSIIGGRRRCHVPRSVRPRRPRGREGHAVRPPPGAAGVVTPLRGRPPPRRAEEGRVGARRGDKLEHRRGADRPERDHLQPHPRRDGRAAGVRGADEVSDRRLPEVRGECGRVGRGRGRRRRRRVGPLLRVPRGRADVEASGEGKDVGQGGRHDRRHQEEIRRLQGGEHAHHKHVREGGQGAQDYRRQADRRGLQGGRGALEVKRARPGSPPTSLLAWHEHLA
ncbi:hypothetical protein THAOC_27523 [Thalassiosira oceanica]|uniref:Uncharacterized protein n=1 Tax=Thalassiosira oceanica TaxID=159749 RepID=K0RIP3_THAOC|nr:hypothetical protein THAOC_27523 [Thalassiosira oceanica]|eukprot:EJK53100.1 hypothetical protein THAOC_27523 [Thalassiosira oceanica]